VNPKISSHATLLRKAIHKAVIAGILSTASLSAQALDAVAYYSDRNSNQVFIVDPRNMLLVDVIPTHGDQPYPIDKVGNDKVYVSTRNSNSLDIIDYDGMSFSNAGIVPLRHKARSVGYNSDTNMALVSGVRKALLSVIDVSTDTVVGVVGDPHEIGSGTITGHPFWVDDDQFLLLDLARNLVHLYKIEQKHHRKGRRGPRSERPAPCIISPGCQVQ
jgi:DNA-binding beta-propeller fold protein YncE